MTETSKPTPGYFDFPTITLWQPWASWIAAGWKGIETRRHRIFRGLVGWYIAIHAGKTWDGHAIPEATPYLGRKQLEETWRFKDVRGVVVCIALVRSFLEVDARHSLAALCDCGSDHLYGLHLINVEPLRQPLPMRGRQGIWQCRLPACSVPRYVADRLTL